jgi:DNA modification methylase
MSRKRAPAPAPDPPTDGTTSLAALVADPQNRRLYNARNLQAIATSLQSVGAARSIVIDEDNVVLAGNGVREAATVAGLTRVRVIEADGSEVIAVRRRGLTPDQKRHLAMFDNRTAELAEWNVAQLQADAIAGLDLRPFFFDDELAALLGPNAPADGHTDPDVVPEPRPTRIRSGDCFELGAHRLLCGDSADPAAVARVLDGSRADALITSPPYNVGVRYGAHDDRPVSPAEYFGWLDSILRAWIPALAPGRAVIWNIGVAPHTCPFRHGVLLEDLGLTFLRQFVWHKVGVPLPTWHMTRDDPRVRRLSSNYTHELVYVFATDTALALGAPQACDATLEHDVFRIHQTAATTDIPAGEQRTGVKSNLDRRSFKAHPAAFPVALPQAFLAHYTAPGETVLEPFFGAGSTMIACERLHRRCVGLEIDPQYCQVAIDRWEAFTGQKARPL